MSAVERHRVRTVLALGLMAAYYGAITCLPATLFAVTFIDWLKGRGGLSLVFGSFFVGVMILWALFPRLERFCPPGPRIDRSSQPELLAAMEEVAAASGQLKPIEWDAVPELAFLPMWRRCCEEHADKLRGLRTADLPKRARPLGDEIARALPATAAHDQRGPAIGRAAEELGLYGAAVAVALYDRGHRLEAGAGQPIVFRNRDATATPVTVDPFESMCALSEGRLGGSEWDSICRAFRIDTVALESAAAARQIEEVAHADGAPR